MPGLTVPRDYIAKHLDNPDYRTFQKLCFDFGVELEEEQTDESGVINWKIDIPANRYDLLCPEGLLRALQIFTCRIEAPIFKARSITPDALTTLTVKAPPDGISHYRPYVVGGILRNITFTDFSYRSFIDLQDKLHQNICRKRTLASMGTHDLDTISGPFTYELVPKKDIKFVPLNQTEHVTGEGFLDFYRQDKKLSKFLHTIEPYDAYPVIYDRDKNLCSLPPIINSDRSKITMNTRNVFIEVTATDLTKAHIVLDTLMAIFSEYCDTPFEFEQVKVVYETDAKADEATPSMKSRRVYVSQQDVNTKLGINLKVNEIVALSRRMSLGAEPAVEGESAGTYIDVPATRHDILHPVDVIEDVGIAFGYNNIPKTLPKFGTVAHPRPINKLSDVVRRELALCGYSEVLAFSLCSEDENALWLRRKPENPTPVRLLNPKTSEFQVMRTTLIPGLLKTVAHSKSHALPIKIFEVGDVIFQDKAVPERRCRSARRVCALWAAKTGGFENIHGMLDRLMLMFEVKRVRTGAGDGFQFVQSEDPVMFPGRCAEVIYKGAKVGLVGVVHPQVLANFEVNYPCSILELDLEPFE